jgi:hypothetical protein
VNCTLQRCGGVSHFPKARRHTGASAPCGVLGSTLFDNLFNLGKSVLGTLQARLYTAPYYCVDTIRALAALPSRTRPVRFVDLLRLVRCRPLSLARRAAKGAHTPSLVEAAWDASGDTVRYA